MQRTYGSLNRGLCESSTGKQLAQFFDENVVDRQRRPPALSADSASTGCFDANDRNATFSHHRWAPIVGEPRHLVFLGVCPLWLEKYERLYSEGLGELLYVDG